MHVHVHAHVWLTCVHATYKTRSFTFFIHTHTRVVTQCTCMHVVSRGDTLHKEGRVWSNTCSEIVGNMNMQILWLWYNHSVYARTTTVLTWRTVALLVLSRRKESQCVVGLQRSEERLKDCTPLSKERAWQIEVAIRGWWQVDNGRCPC